MSKLDYIDIFMLVVGGFTVVILLLSLEYALSVI